MRRNVRIMSVFLAVAMILGGSGCKKAKQEDSSATREESSTNREAPYQVSRTSDYYQVFQDAISKNCEDPDYYPFVDVYSDACAGYMTISFDRDTESILFYYSCAGCMQHPSTFLYKWSPSEEEANLSIQLVYEDRVDYKFPSYEAISLSSIETFLAKSVEQPESYSGQEIDQAEQVCVKDDLMKLYARTAFLINQSFEQLHIPKYDFQFGTEYTKYSTTEPLSDEKPSVKEEHTFSNGKCSICNRTWMECLFETCKANGIVEEEWGWFVFPKEKSLLQAVDTVDVECSVDTGFAILKYKRDFDEDLSFEWTIDVNRNWIRIQYSDRRTHRTSCYIECSISDLDGILRALESGKSFEELKNDYVMEGNLSVDENENSPNKAEELQRFLQLTRQIMTCFESNFNEFGLSLHDIGFEV